jgi:hypothetical protein
MNSDNMTVLQMMFAAYPTVEVTEALLANYLRHLALLTPDELQTACDAAVRVCKFPPTIADILEQHAANTSPDGLWRTDKGARYLTMSEIETLPEWPPRNAQLYRQTRAQRRKRLGFYDNGN